MRCKRERELDRHRPSVKILYSTKLCHAQATSSFSSDEVRNESQCYTCVHWIHITGCRSQVPLSGSSDNSWNTRSEVTTRTPRGTGTSGGNFHATPVGLVKQTPSKAILSIVEDRRQQGRDGWGNRNTGWDMPQDSLILKCSGACKLGFKNRSYQTQTNQAMLQKVINFYNGPTHLEHWDILNVSRIIPALRPLHASARGHHGFALACP